MSCCLSTQTRLSGICVLSCFNAISYSQSRLEKAQVVIPLGLLLTGLLNRANAEVSVDGLEGSYSV